MPNSSVIAIIDGNSLINRAYYAIRSPMMTKEGLYTQGVYGFLNMLAKVRKDYAPGHMVVAFDRKAPTFRHEEYSEYKSNRKKMPSELAVQIPLLKEVLKAMKIKIMEIDGFEADDILGTVASKAEEEGMTPLIITGDKDALQLVTSKTTVVITKKGISEMAEYDQKAFIEEYGFRPEQLVDYKGLMGDSSDNIPGLPGVGRKTAQKLIIDFGTIDNLLENVDKIQNKKLRLNVEENAQLAVMSRRLAEINKNVPLPVDFDECAEEEPDYGELIEIYRKLEFNSFLKKMQQRPESEEPLVSKRIEKDGDLKTKDRSDCSRIRIEKPQDLLELKEELDKEVPIYIKVIHDGNHRGNPKIEGIGFLTDEKYFYIPGGDEELYAALYRNLAHCNAPLIGHGLKDDYYALLCNGFDRWIPVTAFDGAIGQYLLEPGRGGYDLPTMLLSYLHKELGKGEDGTQMDFLPCEELKGEETAFQWCIASAEIMSCIRPQVEKEGLCPVMEGIELPLIYTLASMEAEGFAVDRSELNRIGEILRSRIESISKKIYSHAGEEFNINSPKQLGVILFDRLGLPAGKKTKSGYSTNAEVLEQLRGKHQIIEDILEYRSLAKLNGTYVEGLLPLIHVDGKIHAHFQQTVTATGRISCTEPNLQNIPIRQELGRLIRKAFIPSDEGRILIGADYSQIELRVLAHMSEDPVLVDAFNRGEDIHKSTASRIWSIPENEVTPQQRSNAKAVNFGVIYGMSGFGLASELGISRKEAESYIEDYYKKHMGVRRFMDDLIAQADEKGYVTTIMGRRRMIPEMKASNRFVRQAGERLAMNSPIQGSAADIIKLAMIRCDERLRREGLKSRLILQVHDELIIEALKEEEEQVKTLLKETMEDAITLKVPLIVDLNMGNNWYELK
ncbi:MAG: DNA polymerase I [Anaerovoracaceae bacterium]|jgi:DNA polymerase-1